MRGIQSDSGGKEVSLEAVRGLAAVVVVFWHSCLAFMPEHTGAFPQYETSSWQGSPLFVLLNGQSAVALFFVLSGYVLTRKYFLTGNLSALVRGAIKRWPRFVGPVFMTIFASYLLFRLNLYSYAEAGKQSGSPWLVTFGWEIPDSLSTGVFWRALKEATYAVFFREDALFDTSLWTMHIEMIGSFIVFGMAPVLAEAKKISKLAVFIISGYVVIIAHNSMPNLVAFPVGVTIAVLLPHGRNISRFYLVTLLIASLYLLGYSGKFVGIYSVLKILATDDRYTSYFAVTGSAILISVFELCPPLRNIFCGTFSRWLGEFSFPIYLVHALLIFSLGSTVYIRYGSFSAFASVLIATPIAAFPLLLFDRAWVSMVNQLANRMIPRIPPIARDFVNIQPRGDGNREITR